MESRFVQAFLTEHLISIDLIALTGIFFYFRLSNDQRVQMYFWLPFMILIFTVFCENMVAYTLYNHEFNKTINAYLGNTEFPSYNLWLHNITNLLVLTILYFFLIRYWIEPSKKKYMNWMITGFLISNLILQFSGIEPVAWFQPIIFSIGANMILVGSGLYFVGFMTNDLYLNSNPVRLISFWQMTSLLFTYSLTYINFVAMPFLVINNYQLGRSMFQINLIMSVFNLAILMLTIASPKLPKLFEREPAHGYS